MKRWIAGALSLVLGCGDALVGQVLGEGGAGGVGAGGRPGGAGAGAAGAGGGGAATPGAGGAGSAPPPGEAPYTLTVDTSGLDRFVPAATATRTVAGEVTASLGAAAVKVGDADATLMPDGTFSRSVPVPAGLSMVPIVATDRAGHARSAHRSLLRARFLPEGQVNPGAARLQLTETILQQIAAPLRADVQAINVAREIMARPVLSDSNGCVTYPRYAQHQPAELDLGIAPDGTLWVTIDIPSLLIQFDGECQAVLSSAPIEGQIVTNLHVETTLGAGGSGTTCVTGLRHSSPDVSLPGFNVDIRGTGFLTGFLVTLMASFREGQVHDEFLQQFTTQADTLLGQKLASVSLFGGAQRMDLLGQNVSLDLCLVALGRASGALEATVGAKVTAGGTRPAPGAPQLDAAVPRAVPGALLLDTNLVAQALFSAWRAGGLAKANQQQVPLDLLAALVPALGGRWPDDTMVDVDIDGELPPVVRAAPVATTPPAMGRPAPAMIVELGDLRIRLHVGDTTLYELGARISLTLGLEPDMGALKPTVLSSTAEVHLLGEPVADADDAALEAVVQSRLGDSAAALLGGARLALPSLGGALRPGAVTPDAGGRYLRVALQ